ncbi:MAG: hypothetical protein EOP42_18465 [Sphingobacteriaceae bacterium]|nr:MAG: hypothetical protein EOP42_18465 [Sphingobacteriaceae bacterium]
MTFTGIFTVAKAQNPCLPDSVFRTDSLGNYKEKLPIQLIFNIHSKTIEVQNNHQDNVMFFNISEKISCNWFKNFSYGKTSYKVLTTNNPSNRRTALFNIIFEKSGKKYVELLYEGSEERIFTIKNN